ncbi:DUF4197 family protein [Croceicoccus sp. F390]|uniref:DUF4197 family protein n=1 Tax=Croceicoccus esteveae TaxID=3075597 RepID=A0ABU2ZEK9_9SPHN|nr:DUF4197 family protein [Croceicoccus sp. F390]MDT0575038.1 DUF4197 family protein [Croceicoccus sp. F390]
MPPLALETRRGFIARSAGVAVTGALALTLPGCAAYRQASLADAIQRLLTRSSQDAFARLLAPDGFLDAGLGREDLGELLGPQRSAALATILRAPQVRQRLDQTLNTVAADAAQTAAPQIADAVRLIGIDNARDLVNGAPSSATAALRAAMGRRLLDIMVPQVSQGLRIIEDPVIGPALSQLAGINLQNVTALLAGRIEETIWAEIGRQEAMIRANPAATGDRLLQEIFGAS